jgi:hypothetical protein
MVGLQPPRLDTIPSYRYALECQIRMHPARFFLSPLTFGCISRLCCDSQAGLRVTGRILTMSSCLGSAPGIIVCAQCSQRCSVFTHYTTLRTHTHTRVPCSYSNPQVTRRTSFQRENPGLLDLQDGHGRGVLLWRPRVLVGCVLL